MSIIVTITGPSLSGKSTLEAMLVKEGMAKAVSTTTRQRRDGEIDGVQYNFVTLDEFDKIEKSGNMVESVSFDGNKYGVTSTEVKNKFLDDSVVVIVVEPNGARQIKEYAQGKGWDCLQVLVTNPDEVLKKRFDARLEGDVLAKKEVYENRWNAMKTVEKEWCKQMSGADLKFGRFDETNESDVMNKIIEEVNALKNKNSIKKVRKP